MDKLNILGTEYHIERKKYDEDPKFKEYNAAGYCNGFLKSIVLCDMSTFPDWDKEDPTTIKKQEALTYRHEIVHAYLNESGLADNSHDATSWARNEEIVDWIALQGQKIYNTWKEAGCIG